MPVEEITNLALRRNLFFPAAEIYPTAQAGFWDFGPMGTAMRNHIIAHWRRKLVQREGMLEIDGAQILPRDVFKASGHLDSFNDPIVQCKKTSSLHRADTLIENATGKTVPESLPPEEMDKLIKKHNIKSPAGGELGKVRVFNMMMGLQIGATGDNPAFLRPETCQNIFLDFARLYKSARSPLPLGIAQAGKSFRNEIAPKQGLLREREFSQMEIEVFFDPEKINEVPGFEDVAKYKLRLQLLGKKAIEEITCKKAVEEKIVSGKLVAYYLARLQQYYASLNIPVEKMRFRELEDTARAFYAKETWDFEVETDNGWIELVANNYRTDYDLNVHGKGSKKSLSVKEEGKEILPHVWEISAGVDRSLFVVLDATFRKEKRGKEARQYLDLPPFIAPFLVGVYPLQRKDGHPEKAREVFKLLRDHHVNAHYDQAGSIGRRYARADEIGVPYGVTCDYDTLKDDTVTLRERNSMEQKRVPIKELPKLLWELSAGVETFSTL